MTSQSDENIEGWGGDGSLPSFVKDDTLGKVNGCAFCNKEATHETITKYGLIEPTCNWHFFTMTDLERTGGKFDFKLNGHNGRGISSKPGNATVYGTQAPTDSVHGDEAL